MSQAQGEANESAQACRLDKWLWAARFYKTRSLAAQDIDKGRVRVTDQVAKASRGLKLGDTVELRQGEVTRVVVVRRLSGVRGSATVAQAMYEETPESVARREHWQQTRHLRIDPAQSLTQGRPTKKDRRLLQQLKGGPEEG